MECLGLHNKPKAEVHPGHLLTGPKEEEEEEEEEARKSPLFIGFVLRNLISRLQFLVFFTRSAQN
jgi:hypothetical protein